MKAYMMLVVLAVTACGNNGARVGAFDPISNCGSELQFEDKRGNCDCYRRQVEAAKQLVVERTGLMQMSDLDGITVYYSAKAGIIKEGGCSDHGGLYFSCEKDSSGATWNDHELITERYGRAIAHELMHVWQLRNGVSKWETAAHEGWKERGWIDMGDFGWNTAEICIDL